MFTKDFKELLSAFNAHQVKYLIVGGYAVAIHAQPRATKDLDIFVQPVVFISIWKSRNICSTSSTCRSSQGRRRNRI